MFFFIGSHYYTDCLCIQTHMEVVLNINIYMMKTRKKISLCTSHRRRRRSHNNSWLVCCASQIYMFSLKLYISLYPIQYVLSLLSIRAYAVNSKKKYNHTLSCAFSRRPYHFYAIHRISTPSTNICTNVQIKKNKYAIHTQRHQSCVCVSFTVQKDMWSGW